MGKGMLSADVQKASEERRFKGVNLPFAMNLEGEIRLG